MTMVYRWYIDLVPNWRVGLMRPLRKSILLEAGGWPPPTHSLKTPLWNQPCNGIAMSVKSVVNEVRLWTYHKNEHRVRESRL